MKCKSISTWYGKGASMELCCNRRLVDIAGAEMHGLGFNISIKHSSVPSAGKNQSVRLNTKWAAYLYLTAEPKWGSIFLFCFYRCTSCCLPKRIKAGRKYASWCLGRCKIHLTIDLCLIALEASLFQVLVWKDRLLQRPSLLMYQQ